MQQKWQFSMGGGGAAAWTVEKKPTKSGDREREKQFDILTLTQGRLSYMELCPPP